MKSEEVVEQTSESKNNFSQRRQNAKISSKLKTNYTGRKSGIPTVYLPTNAFSEVVADAPTPL